ncbi:uncharacterized protein Z518_01398 [Rhinocladiella mackenziei CBS 650.93]|uniref:protein-tyrosine-phosphatase n=1 Tax=Rhinocladiella mackenziei CBS 650.93 TaxID=1442369 RepID=A0A0D2J3L1_9EURO|nr:uncharacterized protein Z518_01398 [Rhinocladiella mackenziei CBS 650.93]KIX10316.1 hypothetical protein Z518_01398 [Rhinocladiella mackenziei CBS 650.93]
MDNPTLSSKCPGYNLYIDGFQALRRPKALQGSNITHIVSVVDWKFPQGWAPLRGFQHLRIPLDDVQESNILAYFPRSNAFIHEGLNYWAGSPSSSRDGPLQDPDGISRESGVLVHCAMGVSRSATIVVAYLMWISRQPQSIRRPHPNSQSSAKPPTSAESDSSTMPEMISLPPTPLTVDTALALVRQCRPQVEPNSGFIKQLRMYEAMGCPTTQEQLESHKIYRRWVNSLSVMDALSGNRAPEMADISFRDEEDDDDADKEADQANSTIGSIGTAMQDLSLEADANANANDPEITDPGISTSSPSSTTSASSVIELKCRKCRRLIAKSSFIIPHQPPLHRDPSAEASNESCAHVFLHPLSWMRPVLADGGLDGRLACPNPKCGANIGKFAWQGLRCSCGGWVTPGFGIMKSKVDEVRSPTKGKGIGVGGRGQAGAGLAAENAIRLPPGMRKGVNGNL